MMNINNDNYEEYFLLFADNELSPGQKNMVEDFVKEHPQLQEEFLNITQSVLKPEISIKLEDKNSLLRQTSKMIDDSNFSEIFVRYIDDELTAAEKKETEAFAAGTPALQDEFELLQRIKLQPDKRIVFPDKKSLFKKESGGKIIPFKWWKAIAAAVFVGLGSWIGIELNKDKPTAPGLSIIRPEKTVKLIFPKDTGLLKQENVADISASSRKAKLLLKQRILPQKNPVKTPLKSVNATASQVLNDQKKTNHLPGENINNEPQTILADIPAKQLPKNMEGITGNTNNIDEPAKQDEIVNSVKNAVPGVIPASYSSNESENSNNYAFYNITEEKFNKSKVGGFLRKVKRIVGRKISPLTSAKNQKEIVVN